MGRGQELLDAARKGDVRTVTKILTLITKRSGPFTSLRRGAGVNVQDDNGYTPLHRACMNGHREIVHLLLKVDASPCIVDKKGATPLHLAAWKGDSHVVSMLLGHCNPPVNIDQKTNDQETALLIAAQFGHVDVVSQLIAKGADVYLKNNKEESPLDLASQYGKLETVAQLISAHPQLLDPYRFPISRGRSFPTTPLHRATMNGNKDVVKYLIDAGMDPNVRTENGTALHEGIRYLQASTVKVLLSKGADLKAKDRQGNSVHALLAKYPDDATKRVKKYIREYENQIKISYESEEDLPPIPVNDYPSPVSAYANAHGMKAPETQKTTNIHLSLSQSSSSLTKNHQSFVKKLASKCLGLKAKFNSAPNISNSLALDSDVSAKPQSSDNKSSTNTLLIGNSKFFNKILSKKEESGEIICNDEFDTISLDRLGTLNRDSPVNRSNRSCPGFKTSLPNISENAELSDTESVVITEIDCDNPKTQQLEAVNLHTKLTIFEPRQRISSNNYPEKNNDSADLVNECYEPCTFSDDEADKQSKSNNNLPKPSPRVNVANSSEDDLIYENFAILNKIPPTPAVRNNVPSKILLDELQRKALYENISIMKEKNRDETPCHKTVSSHENEVEGKEKSALSRSSTMSSDSMEDESNLEDILLSEKSKSFRRLKKISSCSSKCVISRTQSNASNASDFTEASAIENVDCSEEIYTTMSGTLPNKSKVDSEKKKKVLFRHKTFTNIEVDRQSVNLNSPLPYDHNDFNFMKETLPNYHIRGTGHCVHKAPTVTEFIYIFNRETLYSDTPPFTLMPNNKRESYYETAICFCRPQVPKYHKSAEDLLQLSYDAAEENKVTIDLNALRARTEIVSTSFRCFCDSGQCTFHSKRRESPDDLIVKFSAVKKSISTPDITLDPSFSAINRSSSMRNPSSTSNTESHYAVSSIEDIVLRNKKMETANPESPIYTVMSQPSTLTSSVGQYSIKDISDVISLNSHSESADASLVCALNSAHIPLRKSTSSEYSDRWTLASSNSNTTVRSDTSFKTCIEDPEEDSDDDTLHSDEDSSDAETVKSDVSTGKRPWVHSDSFNFGQSGPKIQNYAILEEDSNSDDGFDKFESPSKIESGISVEGSESSSSGCDEDSGIPGVDGSLGVASLERVAGSVGVRSGSGRRRWDEPEGASEGDALSISSAASSCAPHHLAHHHDYSKVSPTPPKKPPRRNLSVSPTHANSPSSGYSYELRTHARSQDDLDEIQGAKNYLKHGRSVDQYVDGKLSYSEFEENHNSPRVAPVPTPRPSLKQRPQPVAITAMYENVVIKEQNPRRKLRRNNFGPQNDNEPMEERVRKYSNQDRSSLESLLDDQSINSPSDCERYYEGPRVDIPLSPTHYEQPPTPEHPPPSARQAENSIHERIRPLSQLIMEVVEEIRIRKKSQADELGKS